MIFFTKKRVYCQSCGTNITNEGGYISKNGQIFGYHHQGRCLEEAAEELEKMLPQNEINVKLEYRTAKEVQEDIKNWEKVQEYKKEGKEIPEDIKKAKQIHYHKLEKFLIKK